MATDNKYDRQLRLWGARGQEALMNAHILLINAGAAGTETLKNLVLPGVGEFTVLDNALTTAADLGNNFFVTRESVGLSRAEETCKLLCEMNPDVKGHSRVGDAADLLVSEPAFFTGFTLIVASQMAVGSLQELGRQCWANNVPLLVVRSFGLLGVVRLQLREHEVVDTKPDNDRQDLRISRPWPELQQLCTGCDLSQLDGKDHAHTPFVILLQQALQNWMALNGGAAPQTFADKQRFKDSVKAMARDYDDELNFQEAYDNAYKAYAPPCLPSEVTEVLQDDKTTNLSKDASHFRILARAVSDFMADQSPLTGGGGLPPLAGDIPDMTSDTDRFIALQKVYQAKAERDREAIKGKVRLLLESLDRPADSIPAEDVEHFCRNVQSLAFVHTRPLAEESSAPNREEILSALEDPFDPPEQTPAVWYLALRGVDRFEAKHGRLPGEEDSTVTADGMNLWSEIRAFLKDADIQTDALTKKHALELTRYGGVELHTIASVVGGIASQEAVKVITKQYMPINNTVVFNGIAGVVSAMEL